MTYGLVGMRQAAIMPREGGGLVGLATHGIDSCTGVVLVTEDHIFLAHMPPAPPAFGASTEVLDAYRREYKGTIDAALSRMSGDLTRSMIISPNTKHEFPNGGPVIIRNTLKIVYGIRPEKVIGNRVTVDRATGNVNVGMGTVRDYTTMTGGTDDNWLVVYIN